MKNRGLHLYSILVAVATLCLIVSGAMVASQNGTPEGWHRAIGAIVAVLVLGLAVGLAGSKKHQKLRPPGGGGAAGGDDRGWVCVVGGGAGAGPPFLGARVG